MFFLDVLEIFYLGDDFVYKEKLDFYFEKEKEKIIRDLVELIKIESICDYKDYDDEFPYGEKVAKVIDVFLQLANQYGFRGENIKNKIGYIDFDDNKTKLDILTHLDVVPADDNWTITLPFEPILKNNRIYGRGAADDKGAAIACLYAMKAVKDLNIDISKNVRLIFGGAEETGNRDDLNTFYNYKKQAEIVIAADAHFPIINLEKGKLSGCFRRKIDYKESDKEIILSLSSGIREGMVPDYAECILKEIDRAVIDILIGEKEKSLGIIFEAEELEGFQIKVKAIGKGMHIGRINEANNALTGMLDFVSSLPIKEDEGLNNLRLLNEIFPHGDCYGVKAGINLYDDISGHLYIAPTILKYTENILEIKFSANLPICATEDNTLAVMRGLANKNGFEFVDYKYMAPHYVSEENYLVKYLMSCYEKYTGKEAYTQLISGSTYVHFIEGGVAFGCMMPGVDYKIHQADEFMDIDDLITSAKIYTQVIIDLCK